MKIKNICLSFVLCLCCLVPLFGLLGCGGASLNTLKENFQNLQEIYVTNVEKGVFVEGSVDENMENTKYLVTYGNVVTDKVNAGQTGYVQLKNVYNVIFAISNSYIDNNKDFILNRSEEEMSKESKNAMTQLNSALVEYMRSINTFVKARLDMIDYFDGITGQISEQADEMHLSLFKKAYGEMISKNLNFSIAMARMVETTEIFDIVSDTAPTLNDSKLLKEYISAKMLPIFAEFRLSEIENKFNYNNSQFNSEAKKKVGDLLDILDTQFVSYKTNLVANRTPKQLESQEAKKALFTMFNNFFVEMEDYFKALKGVNFKSLLTNGMEKHYKSNPLAEIYLQKVEQFLSTSLPEFMKEVCSIIY